MIKNSAQSTSDTSRISTESMKLILEKLRSERHCESTKKSYIGTWRKFNEFLVKLDQLPSTWEERTSLYIGYLFNKGIKSTTVKSYISAIKAVLEDDNYEWNDKEIKFSALTRGCKMVNDRVKTRLPIGLGLLEILLDKIEQFYDEHRKQHYLAKLYQCVMILGYYGLLRIGEMTKGNHPVKAKDVHAAKNKRKILVVLFTSKTHGLNTKPQQIHIVGRRCFEKSSILPFQNHK